MGIQSARLLRTFCTVVEFGGFSGAQQALGMSQPAISGHIKDLETVLGYQLCMRGRSGFFLTERGRMAYEKCRRMLNQMEDFEAELLELRDAISGTLRIGLVDAVLTYEDLKIPAIIEKFCGRKNDVFIEMKAGAPSELEVDLLNNNIHVAIGPFSQRLSNFSYRYLTSEAHGFYCGRNHPLFDVDANEVSLDLIRPYPVSSRAYLQHAESKTVEYLKRSASVYSMEAQAILISSGRFLGFLPEHYAKPMVDAGVLRKLDHPDLVWTSDFYMVTREAPAQRQAIRVFMEDVLDTLAVRDGAADAS